MLSESQRQSLERATEVYEVAVGQASEYLQGRGIAPETQRTYRLGFVEQGEYAGRLAIPYITADGSVVDIRFRALTDSQTPKYLSRPGVGSHLFSVSSLLADGDSLYLTEGEIDAMTMNQMGFPAVGVPGVKNWKGHYGRLMEDYDRVVVVCDGDQAGRDFGKGMIDKIESVELVHLPEGQDVNSMYVSDVDELLAKVGSR